MAFSFGLGSILIIIMAVFLLVGVGFLLYGIYYVIHKTVIVPRRQEKLHREAMRKDGNH